MAILSIYIKKNRISFQILHTHHYKKRYAGLKVSQSVVRKQQLFLQYLVSI